MSTVSTAFGKAAADNRAALVGYLPAGFPDVQGGIDALTAMVDAGCDVIEIGLPYSDPVMDGPTIQAATEPAVRAGVGVRDALAAVRAVVDAGGAAVTMGYWNQVERYGVERYATDLDAAGGSGAITPDLIPEEAGVWIEATDAHALAGALDLGRELGPDAVILVNLSGRGDKDVETASAYFGIPT